MAQQTMTPPRGIEADPLGVCVQQIHQVLAVGVLGEWGAWPGVTWYALSRLENELRRTAKTARDPDGLATEIDQTRPTLLRQQEKLCQAYRQLLEECSFLKWQLYRATRLDHTPEPRRESDRLALRGQLERFLTKLERSRAAEVDLILESATTDIGTGD